MEFNILYVIQAIHSSFLDNIILALTKIMGDYGQIWLLVSFALLIPKKTRKLFDWTIWTEGFNRKTKTVSYR